MLSVMAQNGAEVPGQAWWPMLLLGLALLALVMLLLYALLRWVRMAARRAERRWQAQRRREEGAEPDPWEESAKRLRVEPEEGESDEPRG